MRERPVREWLPFSGYPFYVVRNISSMKSRYAKFIYRDIYRYGEYGAFQLTPDEFRRRYRVPKCYRMCHITTEILDRVQRELSEYLEGLRIEKIKIKGRVVLIVFLFDEEFDNNQHR